MKLLFSKNLSFTVNYTTDLILPSANCCSKGISVKMNNTKTGLVLWILLALSLITLNNGEFVAANVTKSVQLKKEKQAFSTTTPKSVVNNGLASSSEKDFPIPRAVSVNAVTNENTVFHLPPPFYMFGENEDAEETFTYQVRKQRRQFPVPNNFNHEGYEFQQKRVRGESYEAVKQYVNRLISELSNQIINLNNISKDSRDEMQGNFSLLNSTLEQLKTHVVNLTKLADDTSRVIQVFRYVQEHNKALLLEQVSNLTKEVETLKTEKSEEMIKITTVIANFQAKLDNTTQQIRVHEAYLRYGQQAMASMKSTLDKISKRITDLELAGGPHWAEQTVGCGGVIVSNAGIISYKFRQPYLNNERCVWIIRANRRTQINLQLLEDGFQNQSSSDYLTVTEFAEDQHPVTLITNTRLEHGNNNLHTFRGPVIFVTFYSDDASVPGTGFTLRFDGIGNSTDPFDLNAVRHLNLHYSEHSGIFTYPMGNAVTYQPNEIVTLAINPFNATSVKIHMKTSELEKDEYCEFDSISFYGSVTGSYALTKRYCQQNEKFSGEIIQSSDGIFLVIFRSDASTQFSGFEFSWEAE